MQHPINKSMANLAFSQNLVDQIHAPKPEEMAQQSPEMSGQPNPQPEQTQTQSDNQVGIIQSIKDTLTPFMDKITNLISDETKQVELKINGEMTPKENERGAI